MARSRSSWAHSRSRKAASPADICMLALASSHTSPAIQTNGAPTANLKRLQLDVVYRVQLQRTQSGNWHQLYGRINQQRPAALKQLTNQTPVAAAGPLFEPNPNEH